ncbi:MAG: hypothetical protein JWM11_2646 [Planctomycetaceae bacterium]|nr:hypothetical protein [Planctomycetaceae bacterium]
MPHTSWGHLQVSRRTAIQAGSIGLLGLGTNHLTALREANAATTGSDEIKARSVIYIFLSGGLSQHESFDPKPLAPKEIRGDFQAISTATPGLEICEHLPQLAKRSQNWSVVRSLTHSTNDHSVGHHVMLTGRSTTPVGFNASRPTSADYPSLASIVGAVTPHRNNLPPAVVLPEKLIHNTGRVLQGQFGGMMGSHRDPLFIESSAFEPMAYGAFPEYEFDHQNRKYTPRRKNFEMPNLTLPEGFANRRLNDRVTLLSQIDQQRKDWDQHAETQKFDRNRQKAMSLLTDIRVRKAFDVSQATPTTLDRYGRNAFGWSLLMARQLVEAGVNLVQVNLGNNETWDTHGNSFGHLKNNLFPPTDKALSALLDDLSNSGILDSTLIVMAGEFGRTPRVSGGGNQIYAEPGRDHWGALQSVFFAGGGTKGGVVIGSSDKQGAFPATNPQTPENMAATIYHSLGLPDTTAWFDQTQRPHHIYNGTPIEGLLA